VVAEVEAEDLGDVRGALLVTERQGKCWESKQVNKVSVGEVTNLQLGRDYEVIEEEVTMISKAEVTKGTGGKVTKGSVSWGLDYLFDFVLAYF